MESEPQRPLGTKGFVQPVDTDDATIPPTDGERAPKRLKTAPEAPTLERRKGVAPIKAEYLVISDQKRDDGGEGATIVDDDASEAVKHVDGRDGGGRGKREKRRGQNKNRDFGHSRDQRPLCSTRVKAPEFSPVECQYGEGCKFEHDLRTYLEKWKRPDLDTFGSLCPVWKARGRCVAGWKCRFVGSHMSKRNTSDGREELILTEDKSRGLCDSKDLSDQDEDLDILNDMPFQLKHDLSRKKIEYPNADSYSKWLDTASAQVAVSTGNQRNGSTEEHEGPETGDSEELKHDSRADYTEPPFRASEKRRIYFGPETPVLAPLTTQGNLPFRRLCVELGAQLTYSEMAMSMSLVHGQKSELALLRAHRCETLPPRYNSDPEKVVRDYDNSKDLKFGAQIAGNKPHVTLKATELLTRFCPHLRVIDLNCGCPIDLVYKQGAGSALLDHPTKLEKMLKGMNAVSGDIPITCKIRTGTKDGKPTAERLVNRLVFGDESEFSAATNGPSGVAAITLHGRSRAQRYTRLADWEYIASCAALIRQHTARGNKLADTIREADPRDQPGGGAGGKGVYFLGNGDCFSHTDYYKHLEEAGVDSVMVARGALIKPWIFEEIEKGQYLDKSANERLALVERFARYGLETWGSDEIGVGQTRRFLLEWLSFAYRYVPVGILEHLPPNIQDRPPPWKGRNELETLLGSNNYKDWIKISEMFLGPAHKDFKFQPKHKSNSYEIEAEG